RHRRDRILRRPHGRCEDSARCPRRNSFVARRDGGSPRSVNRNKSSRRNRFALMTLNLMLTSKDAVYLSGDFRLTSIPDQAALPDSFDTQKLIPVIRREWAALIGYMGVASAPPVISDMGQWIVEQMDSIPLDGNVSELSRRLIRFNLWLG